jgi:hypothetical protein
VPAPRPSYLRPLLAGGALLGLVLALAACGGSSSSGASSTTGAGGQRPGGGGLFAAARDPKVQACLKKAGVTLPNFGGRPPGTGTRTAPPPPATGTNARPPAGANGRRFGGAGGDPAQFAKVRAAMAKCGVKLPARPAGGPAAPATTS